MLFAEIGTLDEDGKRRTLGKYELLRRIACGGMAELYLARSRSIGGFEKMVALKRILPQFSDHDNFVTMFLDEARLAATLNHPNIAQVFDIGVHEGEFFFAMEFVGGRDLRHVLRRCKKLGERVPLNVALTILASVARGLHYAHVKADPDGAPLNIIHRDISPQNIIATYDGGVKIVDFGIAKATTASQTTQAGILKGKYSHMSPEQSMGEELDRRSDLFSFGTLMWELMIGRQLFQGDALQILEAVANGAIPAPSSIDPDFDPGLEAIIMRCLERDLDKRPKSAEEIQLALEDLALESRIRLSTVDLTKFMRRIFREEAAQWLVADAPSEERSEHIISYVTSVSEVADIQSLSPNRSEFASDMEPTDVHSEPSITGVDAEPTDVHRDSSVGRPRADSEADTSDSMVTGVRSSTARAESAISIVKPPEDRDADKAEDAALRAATDDSDEVPRLEREERSKAPAWFIPAAVAFVLVGLGVGALLQASRGDTDSQKKLQVVAPDPAEASAEPPTAANNPAVKTPNSEAAAKPPVVEPDPTELVLDEANIATTNEKKSKQSSRKEKKRQVARKSSRKKAADKAPSPETSDDSEVATNPASTKEMLKELVAEPTLDPEEDELAPGDEDDKGKPSEPSAKLDETHATPPAPTNAEPEAAPAPTGPAPSPDEPAPAQ